MTKTKLGLDTGLDTDPAALYVFKMGGAAQPDGSPPLVATPGERLPGSHPKVQALRHLCVPDGADDTVFPTQIAALYGASVEEAVRPELKPPSPPLRDEDALICIKPVHLTSAGAPSSADVGDRVAKDSAIAKADKSAFVPVATPGVERDEALVAIANLSAYDDNVQRAKGLLGPGVHKTADDVYTVYAGTWLPRSSKFVALHPASFKLPELDLRPA